MIRINPTMITAAIVSRGASRDRTHGDATPRLDCRKRRRTVVPGRRKRFAAQGSSALGIHAAILAAVLLCIAGCRQSSPTTPSPPMIVYTAGDVGVVLPTVITSVKPAYTAEAIAAHIQGAVFLSAIVLADGTVGDVTVTTSLDTRYGLDAQAISAVKRWLFNPGTRDGKPVAVRVSIEMTFTLI